MKRFFFWFLKPWVLALFVVLLLCLGIWLEAPLLAFNGKAPFVTQFSRWILIAIMFSAWLGFFVWRQIIKRSVKQSLLVAADVDADSSVQLPDATEAADAVAALNLQMQEAINELRRTKGNGAMVGHRIQQLPLYLMMGSPDSGKTTSLMYSGLKFSLMDRLGQSGTTRYCDWWFTDDAILLDIAGRYVTHDKNTEVDRAVWDGFLGILKKYRPRRSISGVILFVSVSELLESNINLRQTQALAIRERIKQLHERLGIRFPVYVMVTKSDMLIGFAEFFDNLGREERAQVWGVTFPLPVVEKNDHSLAAFPGEFQLLEEQLRVRIMSRLQQEPDARRRALIFGFPQQFANLGDKLSRFLEEVFQPTRYEEQALVRGVYFTSSIRQSNLVEPENELLVQASNTAMRHSYFVTRLMRDVVFKETGIAGNNLHFERKRHLLQWSGIGAVLIMIVIFISGLMTSYYRNQNYISEFAIRAAEIKRLESAAPVSASLVFILPLLNAARELSGGYSDRENNIAWLDRFGLYQGNKLGIEGQVMYRRLLREILLPRIVNRMKLLLRNDDNNNPEYLYEVLRAYLMLGDRRHFDAPTVRAWVDFDWSHNLREVNDAQRQQLSMHVDALLFDTDDTDMQVSLDTELIAHTRQALVHLPTLQRIYKRLKIEIIRSKLPEFNLNDAVGPGAGQVFMRRSNEPLTRGIAGIYTTAGYHKLLELTDQVISDVFNDSWVLGQQESGVVDGSLVQIKGFLKQLYFDEYIKQWDFLLADIRIVPLLSFDQGARVANTLAGDDSPLRKLLQAVALETSLDGITVGKDASGSVNDLIKGKLDAARKKLETALAGTSAEAVLVRSKPVNPVDAHFYALHALLETRGTNTAAPIEHVLTILKDLAAYFDAANAALIAGIPAPSSEALIKLKREADGKPMPLLEILKNFDIGGTGLMFGSERTRLNSLWLATGAKFCKQAIAGRYPIVRSAAQEITLDDFGKFFGSGGVMDDFFKKNLVSYVDMSKVKWSWRTVGKVSLDISPEVLHEFQRATILRDMFFVNESTQPSLRLALRPVSADAFFTKVTLDLDGQVVTYLPDTASHMMQIKLPSGKGNQQVHIETEPPVTKVELKTDGPWAWFRMLDKGSLVNSKLDERFTLNFDLDGRKIYYEFTASSVINPFNRDVLENFHCLDSL